MQLTNQGIYHFGEFHLNLDMRTLARQGERVALGSKAFDVLACLVTNAGRVVSKSELLETAWFGSFVEEGAITQQIFSLRKALGDKADYIATISGRGYRFVGAVRQVLPQVDESAQWDVVETRERTHVVIEEPMPLPAPVAAATPAWVRRYVPAAVGVVTVALTAGWMRARYTPLPDHEELVLADFSNTTGDPAFDVTLRQALEIDLNQSPFVDVLSGDEEAATLEKMGLKRDSAVTANVAREICERTNRQVSVAGNISRVGDAYLVMLDASDCNTGRKLASAKAETESKAQVLGALDSVAAKVRSKLGESARSVQGFDVPLSDGTTPSLDALKAYSVGQSMLSQGKPFTDALQLFQRAVELDPQFSQAYAEIATCYYNLSEPREAADALRKSFDLREHLGAKEKLMTEAHYYDGGLGDWLAAIKAYELWAASYPRDWVPWLDAANLYTQLGKFDPAIAAGRAALRLEQRWITYVVLARAYKNAGRFAEAKALAQESAARGNDSPTMHTLMLEIAFDEHDAAAFAREDQWLATRKDSLHDYFVAKSEAMQGRYKHAEELFHLEIATDRQEGLNEEADAISIEQANIERELGFTAQARKTLDGLGNAAEDDGDYAYQRARLGDVAFAERFLASHANDPHPSSSLLYQQMPEIRAAIAMERRKPQDAVAALAIPSPWGLEGGNELLERGDACVRAGQFDQAAEQYKTILAHPGAFFTIESALAPLGLARAYARAGDNADARAQYQKFLAAWQDADPDVPLLKMARAELAGLR